jgi:hypothetical protein
MVMDMQYNRDMQHRQGHGHEHAARTLMRSFGMDMQHELVMQQGQGHGHGHGQGHGLLLERHILPN